MSLSAYYLHYIPTYNELRGNNTLVTQRLNQQCLSRYIPSFQTRYAAPSIKNRVQKNLWLLTRFMRFWGLNTVYQCHGTNWTEQSPCDCMVSITSCAAFVLRSALEQKYNEYPVNLKCNQKFCQELQALLKYLNLNSKLDILDNFPNDGIIFPTASKKNQFKSSRQKKVSGGGICTPTPPSFSS